MGEDELFNQEGESKTAFNSSLDIIQRISKYEYSLGSCLLYENLEDAFKFLRLIYSEIDFKLKDDEIKEIDLFIKNLKQLQPYALATYNNNGKVFRTNKFLLEDFKEDLYELKRVLNKLKYKVGLGMSDLSDARYALENG